MPAVNIATGTLPDWNKQSNNPELFNMFVGESGKLYCMPGYKKIASLTDTLAVWWSNYDGGNFIVVTELALLRISPSGTITFLTTAISLSQFNVIEVTENLRFQLTITTGTDAYVFDQVTGVLTELTTAQGFELGNPISCTTINSFTVILDNNGLWNISSPNNALVFNPLAVQSIDPQLVKALAVKTVDNNLFIFGTFGIERWTPTLAPNVYIFPLQKDMNFKNNFGAISTNSICSDINNIYFLSSRYIPMTLNGEGIKPIANDGIAKALSMLESVQDPLANNIRSSIFTYRSNYFFQLTFALDNQAWVYCVNSKTWSNTDKFVIDSSSIEETVLLADGLYELTTVPDYALREWVSDAAPLNKNSAPNRGLLNGVELRITQGQSVPSTEQPAEFAEMYISTDRVTWSNAARIPIGGVGARDARTVWPTNISGQFVVIKIRYQGELDFTIEGVDATIN